MGKERYNRQLDIVDISKYNFRINIIGAGGIGSWVTLALAKMGIEDITVYDFDTVEDHNVASQYFKEDQKGMNKVDALKINVLEQSGIEIHTTTDVKEEEFIEDGVVIIAVDSMTERIRLAEKYKDKDIYIIDARMGGLQLEIYCCPAHKYQTTLVDPEAVDHEPCTAKAIAFNCMVIGGLVANYVRKYADKTLVDGDLTFGFNNVEFVKDTF